MCFRVLGGVPQLGPLFLVLFLFCCSDWVGGPTFRFASSSFPLLRSAGECPVILGISYCTFQLQNFCSVLFVSSVSQWKILLMEEEEHNLFSSRTTKLVFYQNMLV